MAESELRNEGLFVFLAALAAALKESERSFRRDWRTDQLLCLLERHVENLIATEHTLTLADESAARQICRQMRRAVDLRS